MLSTWSGVPATATTANVGKEPPTLHLVQACSICGVEIREDRESFEMCGAVCHTDFYERTTGTPRR